MKFLTFKKIGLLTLFLFLLIVPAVALADAQTGVCTNGTKTSTEVGVFMQGVCNECYDEGNCSIADIMTLVANVGNYILSIVASLVFLIYIIGGFFWIASHGDPAWVTKGKNYIRGATVGLVIILVAYTGVVTLKSALVGQLSEGYVICAGDETESQICGINSRCYGFSCIDACSYRNGSCVDPDSDTAKDPDMFCGAVGEDCPDLTAICCEPISPE
jgi:hypothetical protein